MMQFELILPLERFLEVEAEKIVARSAMGGFCLRPRHIDMSSALVPGILSWWPPGGEEQFVAVNGGILVKVGERVQVASRHAVTGELGQLKDAVKLMLEEQDDLERSARTALARLEARFVRGVLDFGSLQEGG